MIAYTYLVGLIVAIGCMTLIDWRYKLAFFHDRRKTLAVVGISVGLFVLWDIAGIALGIFFHGGSIYSLPLRLAPEFPLEELFFLTLLVYSSLIVYRKLER